MSTFIRQAMAENKDLAVKSTRIKQTKGGWGGQGGGQPGLSCVVGISRRLGIRGSHSIWS